MNMKKAPKKVLFLILIQLRQNTYPWMMNQAAGKVYGVKPHPKRLELRPEQ